jgi:hypothetical protein
MKRLLAVLAAVLVFTGCSDTSPTPLSPDLMSGGGPNLSVMQGGAGGAYFLQPLMNSTYSGTFHPGRSPEIAVCAGHSGNDSCASPIVSFNMSGGNTTAQTIRMVAEDEHYIVNWNTKGVAHGGYRIFVVENGYTLAWTDVVVVESGKQMKDAKGADLPVLNGTLPIKVRLEEANGVLAKYYHMSGPCLGNPSPCVFPNGTFVASRIEPRIDHERTWNSFWPGMVTHVELFSAQWTGYVQPLYTETYTFCSTNDDGVRLWIDGTLVVDYWTPQATTERCGAIALQAGQRYSLRKEFFENYEVATAELRWQSASQAKELIPNGALFAF